MHVMTVTQETIPQIETYVGEHLEVGYNFAALSLQLNSTVTGIVWSTDAPDVFTLGDGANNGDVWTVPVTAEVKGCGHVIAAVSWDNPDETPNYLYFYISVIQPVCKQI